jgi:hypothetical protein
MSNNQTEHLTSSSVSAVAQFEGHENSIGFLPITTCPGATNGKGGCADICYARHGRGRFPTVRDKLQQNTETLLGYCSREDERGLTNDLLRLMDRSAKQYKRRRAVEARAQTPLYRQLRTRGPLFRFQWAGDLVDETHARATRVACEKRPCVTCWLYTRSLDLLGSLGPPPHNLTVWLSLDAINETEARTAKRRYPWARIARMRLERTGLVCPKYVDLPTEQACSRCGICYDSTVTSITFPVTHKPTQAAKTTVAA